MIQPISTLKNWFRTGAKPLQQQFWDWMDSFWHKSEIIPSSAISGLDILQTRVETLENASGKVVLTGSGSSIVYQIQPGFLVEKAVVKSTAAMTFMVSTTPGAGDVPIGQSITPGQYAVGSIDIYAETTQNIYFESLVGSVTIILYIR